MAIAIPKYGEGILLRAFTVDDAGPLAEIEYDPEVKLFLAVPSRDRSEWIRTFTTDCIRGWAVEVLPERILAGQASVERTGRRGQGELRIVIAKKYWGRQLGRRVAALLIPAAFEEMDAKSLVATVHPDHLASLALVRSWGFKRFSKKDGGKDDWQHGHLIYKLTRAAYEARANSEKVRTGK